jgi:hypothetical protein
VAAQLTLAQVLGLFLFIIPLASHALAAQAAVLGNMDIFKAHAKIQEM